MYCSTLAVDIRTRSTSRCSWRELTYGLFSIRLVELARSVERLPDVTYPQILGRPCFQHCHNPFLGLALLGFRSVGGGAVLNSFLKALLLTRHLSWLSCLFIISRTNSWTIHASVLSSVIPSLT